MALRKEVPHGRNFLNMLPHDQGLLDLLALSGLNTKGSLSPHLPWTSPYLAKVPGLFLDAVSCTQVDEAIMVQHVLPALRLILQEHSILWRETGRDEGPWGAGPPLHILASAHPAQVGFGYMSPLQLWV